ncbi:MAG: ATP-binding protein [Liquorilactobacillus ghanensis]|uniref:ATP-binding protein n=1 Tax=Liquorilactobacillus ghanensis TaxID=399370 RepID=UPI0039EC540F
MGMARQRNERPQQFLVCISGASSNAAVIQTAAKLAGSEQTSLVGIYISQTLTEMDDQQLNKNFHLAASLGIKVTTLYGTAKARLIAEYAKEKGITKIILGSDQRQGWQKVGQIDLIKQLHRLLPDIDQVVVFNKNRTLPSSNRQHFKFTVLLKRNFNWQKLLQTLAILVVTTILGLLLKSWGFDALDVVLLYILGVMFTAMITQQRSYSLLYSLLIPIVYDYFFTAPFGSFRSNPNNLFTFAILLIVAGISSSWTSKIQAQAILDARRAYRTEILLKTNRLLQQCEQLMEILDVTGRQLSQLLNCNLFILQSADDTAPLQFGKNVAENFEQLQHSREQQALKWSFANHQRAGWGTKIESQSNFIYLPLNTQQQTVAVIAIAINRQSFNDMLGFNLAISICEESEQAIKRNLNLQRQTKIEAQVKQEKLRSDLLRGISHDLRTPLTAIYGNADVLLHAEYSLTAAQRQELYRSINHDAAWLIDLVENLLAMTKVDNGRLKAKRSPELLADIFEAALSHSISETEQRQLKTNLPDPGLLVATDGQLIVQVIVNLLNNAIKYTPATAQITLTADKLDDRFAKITVYNNGPQLEPERLKQIFTLFYSQPNAYSGRRGLGIGLALCQAIVTICGGKIGANNVQPRGVEFWFTLPLWREKNNEQNANIAG